MDGKNGAVVALDPRTGEVLAMVSRPTFDPNKFAGRIKTAIGRPSTTTPTIPDESRHSGAIRARVDVQADRGAGGWRPGPSTTNTVHCPGGVTFYGHTYHCWQKKGHGTSRCTTASCIPATPTSYHRQQDGHRQHRALRRHGGLRPRRPESICRTKRWAWCPRRNGSCAITTAKWYAGETISVAIGQGALTVTPLQLARAIGGSWPWAASGTIRTW
jgi:penicillin-binding protein 2